MRVACFLGWIAAMGVVAAVAPLDAHACFCKSIASKVEHVVWEPSRDVPERIRLEGAFAFRDYDTMPWSWHDPLRGYLYFRCAEGRGTECVSDWEAIEARIASDDGCSGFADFDVVETARIRSFAEEPSEPDVYLPGFGVGDFGGAGITCAEVAAAETEPGPGPDAGVRDGGLGVEPVPDAASPAPDASVTAAPASPASSPGGCAAAGAAGIATPSLALHALLLLLIRRRR